MHKSKSSLFLMELVIVILFFSLSSAVCVQMFVKAHQLDQETNDINHSTIWLQNLIEPYRASQGNVEELHALYEQSTLDAQGIFFMFFDKQWNPCDEASQAVYIASLRPIDPNTTSNTSHGELKHAIIEIKKTTSPEATLISQEIDLYVPYIQEEQ